MTSTLATYVDCPGLADGMHSMRDSCYSCAPFWERIPMCPVHEKKLSNTGWCRECKTHYVLEDKPRSNVS